MKTFTFFLFLLIFLSANLSVIAQDTTVVQTFNLEENSTEGLFSFPNDPSRTYRKILMQYRMRCHDAAVGSGNVGCHEWDYHCNTVLTDSSRVDSITATHPSHVIAGYDGNFFSYVSEPTYSYFQFTQAELLIDNVISENETTIGSGTELLNYPFVNESNAAKTYMLYSAADLTSAGLSAGSLSGLEININEVGDQLDFLKIQMKATDLTELDLASIDPTGFSQVYFLNTPITSAGWNRFNFHTPFDWNGNTGILIEISYNNAAISNGSEALGENTIENKVLVSHEPEHYLAFDGGDDYINVSSNEIDFSEGFTVQAWAYYNNFQHWSRIIDFGNGPSNNNILFANQGTTNNLALHIYDGNSSSNLTAEGVLIENEWVHLAATINGDGQGTLYLNGQEVASGMINLPNTLLRERCYIAKSNWNDDYFNGNMMEVQVWNTALSQTEIQDWMYQSVDMTHPNYDHLAIYYKMDEGDGNLIIDNTSNELDAESINSPIWRQLRGDQLFRNFTASTVRPNTNFVQGEYEAQVEHYEVLDSVQNGPRTIIYYDVVGSDLVAVDTVVVWQAGFQPIIDEDGLLVDIINVEPEATIEIDDLNYYRKFPARYELLSFITPYGNGLDLGDQGKMWTFDVTDFAPILKGSKRLSIEGVGKINEEYEITFYFIEGTPPADVLNIQNIWPISRANQIWSGTWFDDIANDRLYEPRLVTLNSDGAHFKIRSAITGHGQNGEFTPQTHFIDVNGGVNEFEYQVWKECASNPVYPQGGTWIFDRAGWCPGMPTDVHELTLTPLVSPGDMIELDYGISSTNSLNAADYRISNQLVTYGAANFQLDGEIVDILRPSNKVEYERFNPVCNAPQIELRNSGASVITSIKINYGVEGVSSETFEWEGSLEFMESTIITLPLEGLAFWGAETDGFFFAEIVAINGTSDEYADNDRMVSSFNMPPVFDFALMLRYRTNNRAIDNSYTIKDHNGNVVLSKGNFQNNTTYEDEINLPNGCYTFEFFDTAGDGLQFWFFPGNGIGNLSFREIVDDNIALPVKTFDPDFGNGVKFDFIYAGPVSIAEPQIASLFSIYPNPTSDELFVELHQTTTTEASYLEVLDITGRSIITQTLNLNSGRNVISTKGLANGKYIIRLVGPDYVRVKTFVKN